MSDPTKNWKKIRTKVPVHVPMPDGKGIAETVEVEVEAYRNPPMVKSISTERHG